MVYRTHVFNGLSKKYEWWLEDFYVIFEAFSFVWDYIWPHIIEAIIIWQNHSELSM